MVPGNVPHYIHTRRQPGYGHVMDPITASELHYRIKCLKKNKAGGRSGITADILQMLDSDIIVQWLLPLLNACLINEDMPGSAKLFAI